LARRKAKCKIGFYLGACAGNELEWKSLARVPEFAGLKIYMGQSTGSLLVDNDKTLEAHFSAFDPNRPIVVHAEDQKVMEQEGRTKEAALAAVKKACVLGKKYSKRLHIAHISSVEEVELAKKTYQKTTVETCPHYLFIDETQLAGLGFKSGVNPPVRNKTTRRELWKALVNGSVDCISTDHAPHTLEDKKNGAKGYPGLETSLALMLDAYNRKLIPLETIPKMMSENPAKIANLTENGEIRVGMNADLTIVNLKEEWVVRGEEFETKCKWSPFEGRKLKGRNKITVIDGKIAYELG
ncbi:MAG: amidohydrolase family protein, partial [Candidatus Micrarchaeia archaeon]